MKHSPPLIIRVDVPENALNEDLMLVHGDQGSERKRRHLLNHDGVGRSVALENLNRKNKKKKMMKCG